MLMCITFLSKQIEDTCEVARRTDIHRIGNRRNGRTRSILARFQIFEEDIIAVVGSNKMLYRQAHRIGEQTGGDIAEVSTRNRYDQFIRFSHPVELSISIEIVE